MKYQVITFYEFKDLSNLDAIKESLLSAMEKYSVFGTIIIANEGYNSTVCGAPAKIEKFIAVAEKIFDTGLEYKSSYHEETTFQRRKVKIKREIVTLRKNVDIKSGAGTHVGSKKWNKLINDPETIVLDARNDYEYRVGTFKSAINPETDSFTELPDFVEKHFDPAKHRKIAMFCTGGIRCEKFAPYMKEKGFEEIYQLKGGILKYIEETPEPESLWEGECFVFDERISVDKNLRKGGAKDLSLETKK